MKGALDGEGAEFRVLSADLPGVFELSGIAPRPHSIEAIELVDSDARAWRRPVEHNDIYAGGDEMAARRLSIRRAIEGG